MTGNTDYLDRRERYRLEPPPVLEPILTIIRGGLRISAERVIDVNMSGARAEFDASEPFDIAPGQDVTVSVQAPGLDGSADISARIVFSSVRQSRHVVGLVFTQTPDLSDRSTSDFFSVFNRRGSRRNSTPAGHNGVSARLLDPARVELKVINHTSQGIGFIVDEKTDGLLRDRDSLALTLQMPEDAVQVEVTVRICHRASRSDSVYYGCMIQEGVRS
jgi:hypothetical protein